ncbi:GH13027 [Drosophila grimshawi]|uniref:GH13027 n=2 Tax=Drosophila grimshawi TaxID=7222 RepID=B4JRA2_DROGR|nr:GH13027 [Drosophila grimshawi]
MEIDDLNDDCLCIIFEYLPLPDQIAMARNSLRYEQLLSQIVWRKPQFREVSVANEMLSPLSKEDYMYFFELTSAHMEKLYIWKVHEKAFDSYLGRHLLRPELAFYLRLELTNLRELCVTDGYLNNSMIKTITKSCPHLRSLSVSSAYITGKFMVGLHNLKTLVARECSIEAEYLSELLGQLQLTTLDVTANKHNVEETILQAPAAGLMRLERLGISDAQDCGFRIAEQLPEVKELVVSYIGVKAEDLSDMLEATRKLVESSNAKFPKRLQTILCNVVDVEVALEQITGLETRSPRESPKFCELLKIIYKCK